MLADESSREGIALMDRDLNTFERSCDHWSDSGRKEMEGFYALASVDYQCLAEAIDWKRWLETQQKEVGSRCLRLLEPEHDQQ